MNKGACSSALFIHKSITRQCDNIWYMAILTDSRTYIEKCIKGLVVPRYLSTGALRGSVIIFGIWQF